MQFLPMTVKKNDGTLADTERLGEEIQGILVNHEIFFIHCHFAWALAGAAAFSPGERPL